MNSFDVVGYTSNGVVLCPDCASEGDDPIFADSEWDSFPVCDICGERIEDVTLTVDGIRYESESEIKAALRDNDDLSDKLAAILDIAGRWSSDYGLDVNGLLARYVRVI